MMTMQGLRVQHPHFKLLQIINLVRQIDKWLDRQIDGKVDRKIVISLIDKWLERQMDGQKDRQMVRKIDGCSMNEVL